MDGTGLTWKSVVEAGCWLHAGLLFYLFVYLKVSIIQSRQKGGGDHKPLSSEERIPDWHLWCLLWLWLCLWHRDNRFPTISLGLGQYLQEMKLSRGTQSSVKIKENEPKRKCSQEGYRWEDPWPRRQERCSMELISRAMHVFRGDYFP